LLTQYAADYQTTYNAPVSTFGGHGFDALMLVAKAIEMGGSAEPATIRDNLEKIQGFIGTGGIFNFSATDHNGLDASAFEMVAIEQGDWKIIQ